MNLHLNWYGWVGLAACSFMAIADTRAMIVNARRQQYADCSEDMDLVSAVDTYRSKMKESE